jgi:hypothetical protein
LFVPPALLEGKDDALMDGAAFQLAVGLGGLLHGHGCVWARSRRGDERLAEYGHAPRAGCPDVSSVAEELVSLELPGAWAGDDLLVSADGAGEQEAGATMSGHVDGVT